MKKEKNSIHTRCCFGLFEFDTDFNLSESEMLEDINYPFTLDDVQLNSTNLTTVKNNRNSNPAVYPEVLN